MNKLCPAKTTSSYLFSRKDKQSSLKKPFLFLEKKIPITGREFLKFDKKVHDVEFIPLHRHLTLYACKFLNNMTDSEEIVSETFLKILVADRLFESSDHVVKWLYIVVRNACIDILREIKVNRKYKTEMLTNDLLATPDVIDYRIREEKFKKLPETLAEIKALPCRRREVMCLYFFEKKTYKEIAELLKISAQTARNHKTEGINCLKMKIKAPEL